VKKMKKRLELTVDTVRSLTANDMANAVGGSIGTGGSDACVTQAPASCAQCTVGVCAPQSASPNCNNQR